MYLLLSKIKNKTTPQINFYSLFVIKRKFTRVIIVFKYPLLIFKYVKLYQICINYFLFKFKF